jgi:hypothetical protein
MVIAQKIVVFVEGGIDPEYLVFKRPEVDPAGRTT